MTFIAGFIVGIIATFALSTLAALVMGAVIHGRTIIEDRSHEPTVYDDSHARDMGYFDGYIDGHKDGLNNRLEPKSSKPQNTRIV